MPEIPIQFILVFILAFMRVLFFFSLMPLFGDQFTPVRVRLLLSAAVALVFTPLLSARPMEFPQTLAQCAVFMASEALLGLAFGMVGRILFGAVQFAGQLVGEQIGFGMAAIMDPSQGNQMPIIAEALYIMSLLLFFTINAHHLFFGALARSFEQTPPGMLMLSTDLAAFFSRRVGDMFWIALQMSLPVVAIIFATNIAMGMVAKAVPQLNVFLESFPIRIIAGLFLLSATMGLVAKMMVGMFSNMGADLAKVLSLFGA